jgi:23S rRNA (guanosine2251-2'-O)-methyltransferase
MGPKKIDEKKLSFLQGLGIFYHFPALNATILLMLRLNAKELRESKPDEKFLKKIKRNPIYLVLDNIIDTYNVGSLFRLADAVAAEKMYLCGNMEHPPNSRIHKAAVGTENWVAWEKKKSTLQVVKKLKKDGVRVIAVEQHQKSIHYSQINNYLQLPVAIIVGHETTGISPLVLNEADIIVEIPMYGINKSFNVWGSATVICYKVLENL